MDDLMLTEDRRCGKCGEPVTDFESEARDEIEVNGIIKTLSVTYLLKPCGHVFIKAVDGG